MSTQGTTTPEAEHVIDASLVRSLLNAQHPDLADEPLQEMDTGWDNALFRLGERRIVRLPRREAAATLMAQEQRWLPELAADLPLPIPLPERTGRPSTLFPWPWSVVPWLPGRTADVAALADDQADVLADFLIALHRPAPSEAPTNPFRGIPLADRERQVEARVARLRARTDAITPLIMDRWETAVTAPTSTDRLWFHGDLHPLNVLVEDGQLTSVIDWGDLACGDVACDLAAIWMLLEGPHARAACLRRYGADDALIVRARGWAVFFGTALLDNGLTDAPRRAAPGADTLRRLAEDID